MAEDRDTTLTLPSSQHVDEEQQAAIAAASNESNNEDDDGGADHDSDDDDSEDDEPVEWLAQGRDRRSTQANRYASLIQQEAAADDDDDLTLLFAEADGEDVDFEDPDAHEASDVADDDDDDSTDDEDHGPTAAQDDLEGEDQLQKEERAAKRAQKRKADKAFVKPPPTRKKVKIDETASPSEPLQSDPVLGRKRKMSERISWVPTDAPARTSSRTLSVQNKVRTMESMKASEARRERLIETMEAAQKRKDANKAKPLTQAERMAEAAETERINSQSLTRWEEMEKERVNKQKARLEAMQNRKIQGPFLRWYSAKAEWVDGKLKRIGKHEVTEIIEDKSLKDGEPPKKRAYRKKGSLLNVNASKETTPAAAPATSGDVTGTATPTAGAATPAPHTPEPATQEPPQSNEKPSVDALDKDALDTPKDNPAKTTAEAESSKQSPTIYDEPNLFDPQADQAQVSVRSEEQVEGQVRDSDLQNEQGISQESSENKGQSTVQDSSLVADESQVQDISNDREDPTKSQTSHESVDGNKSLESSENKDLVQSRDTPMTKEDESQNPSEAKTNDEPPTSVGLSTPTNKSEAPENRPQTPAELNEASEANAEAQHGATVPAQPATDAASAGPKVTEFSARNLLTLQNYDTTSIQDVSVLRHVVFGTPLPPNFTPAAPSSRANARAIPQLPPKPTQPVCAITGHPAKYRDPATGLPYANLDGYKAIRKLIAGGCVWSNLLGAWCGSDGERLDIGGAAKGVPEGVITGVIPNRPAPAEGNGDASALKTEVA